MSGGPALRFRYRAATEEGRMVEGELEAASEATALGELRRQRLFPVELAPVQPRSPRTMRPRAGRGGSGALLARTLATLLGAGVTLDRALGFAATQESGAGTGEAAARVRDRVRGGETLAAALAAEPRGFGPVWVAMATAGEESGALDEAMARLADHLDEQVEMRAQLRSALIYPALMAATSLLGTLVLLVWVVPRFAIMLEEMGGTLPLSTRLLVGGSELAARSWWIVLPALLLAAAAARAWAAAPANRLRLHAWRLAWPLVGDLERKYAAARLARVVGMLLASGRPLLPALRVARGAVPNAAIAAGVDAAAERVRQGERLSRALAGTLPPLATELIAAGEESGRLDELCLRVADGYDAEVRRALRTAVALVEPALILVFGAVVGFVALAMLQAIYGINTGLS